MRSRRLLVAAGLLLLASACAIKKQPATPQSPRLVPGQGIFFLVNSSREGITISGLSPSRNPNISGKLTLPSPDWARHPIGTEELIVGAHDKNGKILGAYGFPVRRIAFHDATPEKGHALNGGLRGLSSVAIPVNVPNAPGTAFLSFWRVAILARDVNRPPSPPGKGWRIEGRGPYGPVELAVDPLGAVPMSTRSRDIPKLEFPHAGSLAERLPRTVVNPAILGWFIATGMINNLPWACPSGAYTTTNVVPKKDTATSFNIVILGDGYQTGAEMVDFETTASSVATALLANAPFSNFKSQINVFAVETPSAASGVDQCPNHCTGCPCGPLAPDPLTTALEVYGDASGTGTCTEFNADPMGVFAAGCSVLAPADVDLYIVLVNCYAFGAMTYPATRTTYIASGYAADIVAHEAGHALAMIGEEYMGGALPCLDASCTTGCAAPVEFINVALPADVASGKISWLPLAEPSSS